MGATRDNQRIVLFVIAAILCLQVISGLPLQHHANTVHYTGTGNQNNGFGLNADETKEVGAGHGNAPPTIGIVKRDIKDDDDDDDESHSSSSGSHSGSTSNSSSSEDVSSSSSQEDSVSDRE